MPKNGRAYAIKEMYRAGGKWIHRLIVGAAIHSSGTWTFRAHSYCLPPERVPRGHTVRHQRTSSQRVREFNERYFVPDVRSWSPELVITLGQAATHTYAGPVLPSLHGARANDPRAILETMRRTGKCDCSSVVWSGFALSL